MVAGVVADCSVFGGAGVVHMAVCAGVGNGIVVGTGPLVVDFMVAGVVADAGVDGSGVGTFFFSK